MDMAKLCKEIYDTVWVLCDDEKVGLFTPVKWFMDVGIHRQTYWILWELQKVHSKST